MMTNCFDFAHDLIECFHEKLNECKDLPSSRLAATTEAYGAISALAWRLDREAESNERLRNLQHSLLLIGLWPSELRSVIEVVSIKEPQFHDYLDGLLQKIEAAKAIIQTIRVDA